MKNSCTLLTEILKTLRRSIILGSCYIRDYENCFGIPENECCLFFDGYLEYLDELKADGENSEDNIENLLSWYYCFDEDVMGIDDIIKQIQNSEIELEQVI